jgi:hypothetical protein
VPLIISRSITYKDLAIWRNAWSSRCETGGIPGGLAASGSTFKDIIWAIRFAAPEYVRWD